MKSRKSSMRHLIACDETFGVGEKMLQKLGDHIAVCKLRAAECEALAKDAQDETIRDQYLEMAKHWNRLAVSYEFNVSLEGFLQDIYKKGWPFQLENLPTLTPEDE